MDLHTQLSTLLLLALVAPPTPAVAEQVCSPVTPASLRTTADGFSPEAIDRVGGYLRGKAGQRVTTRQEQLAWDVFFPQCDRVIRRFVATMNLRGSEADDCVQDVWAELLKRLPSFQVNPSRGRFTSWLYTIVRSKACDAIRRQTRQPGVSLPPEIAEQLADESTDPTLPMQRRADRQCVRDALELLKASTSDTSFRVLHLRQLEGWSVQQVADTLGLTPQQVWVREHRMKRKLRGLLDPA
jgi:RNA polymerase sigma-70 factor (ECF subfamily)